MHGTSGMVSMYLLLTMQNHITFSNENSLNRLYATMTGKLYSNFSSFEQANPILILLNLNLQIEVHY